MTKLLYFILTSFSAFAVGTACFGLYALVRLQLLGVKRKILTYSTVLLIGVIGTQSVLTYALIDAGTTRARLVTWLYAIGLVIQGAGLLGSAKVAIDRLALEEARTGKVPDATPDVEGR